LLAIKWPRAIDEVLRHPALWVVVVASGVTNAAFNWAVTVGDVVRVVLLFYLMPLWAVLLAWALLGEKPGAATALRVVLSLAGAAVVLWPEAGFGGAFTGPRLPDALGLAGGASFALNNVMLRREARRSDSARAIAMFAGGAAVSLLLAHWLAASDIVTPLPPVLGWSRGAALLGLALWFLASNFALQFGASRLAAHATAVIMVTEVVFASASAIALGAGVLTARVAIGGVLILAAALLAARPARPQ
jgi:drug/metabolite transporter (DMT)-like permease